ncbi:MAG: DNA polymerase IV, partial [Nitrospiraceae bacterium]
MGRWPRQIVFGDVDAMYATAAIVANPTLAGKLVAVGTPSPRGIITAASYPARRYGVTAAMPSSQALRLCPDLVLVPPDRPLYQRLHNRMREVTDRFFAATEWTSIDEFYADATDLQSLHPDPATLGQAVKD